MSLIRKFYSSTSWWIVSLAWLSLLVGWVHAEANAPERPRASIRVALTIDDVPPTGPDAERWTEQLVQALHRARAPATGFVIGERLLDQSGRRALLGWLAGGFALGNHSFGHPELSEVGAQAFAADLERMESLLELMGAPSASRRLFRFPFLDEGRDASERRQVRELLARAGYLKAPVTLDGADWAWAEPYMRCREQGEDEALAALSRSYLDHAEAWLGWSVAAATQLLGRPLTHVMLLHANAVTAAELPRLLARFEARGVQFVSLDEALLDPAYALDHESLTGHTLSSLAQKRGLALPPPPSRPDTLARACR